MNKEELIKKLYYVRVPCGFINNLQFVNAVMSGKKVYSHDDFSYYEYAYIRGRFCIRNNHCENTYINNPLIDISEKVLHLFYYKENKSILDLLINNKLLIKIYEGDKSRYDIIKSYVEDGNHFVSLDHKFIYLSNIDSIEVISIDKLNLF